MVFVAGAVGALLCSAACDDGGASPDGGVDSTPEAAADGGVEARPDASDGRPVVDSELEADGGAPLARDGVALVASDVSFSVERACDLDGDGLADNALAELGETGAESAAMLLDTLAAGALESGYGPGLFFPHLDGEGESALVALSGDATALGGVLRAPYESMDPCGEPAFAHRGELVVGRRLRLSATDYPVLLADSVAAGSAEVTGQLIDGPEGVDLETSECLGVSVRSLGATLGPTQTRGVSLLEVVLAGGSALGMRLAPGLSPDLDMDGDGLERVLLDDRGLVTRCLDGDDTPIEGRECWADERIADAFSLTRRVRYSESVFEGRLQGWMSYCEPGYPEASLFGEGWSVTGVRQLAAGDFHTCLRDTDGSVTCWGRASSGQLGYGNTERIGDDEPACAAGTVELGDGALSVTASYESTCAILPGRRLRCWGNLGEGLPRIGDDETPASGTDLDVGGPVQQLVAGWAHYCALLSGGRVRCWGRASEGALGYGNTEPLTAADAALAPDVPVGGRVLALAAGDDHTCALLLGGGVRCWGDGSWTPLGYGNTDYVGDDETPAEVGDVDLGGRAIHITAGDYFTCALLEGGRVRCWGVGLYGQLGYGSYQDVGDDETPASVGDVNVGGTVTRLDADGNRVCAILEGGALRCWGEGETGSLGYGHTANVGDNETPADAGDVDVGGPVVDVTAGYLHTCALLEGGSVRCWGTSNDGALGYGNTDVIGDDETPADAGDVPLSCSP